MTPRRADAGRAAVTLALLASALAGCASTNSEATTTVSSYLSPTTTTTPPPTSPATTTTSLVPPTCTDGVNNTQSYPPSGPPPPPGAMPPGSRMATILGGQLRVGVDETSPFFSKWDPEEERFVGLEADLARELAKAIFGDVPDLEAKIKFVTVTTEQKFTAVADDKVDVMISVASMTCSRWKDFNFSSPYYEAFQQLAFPEGSPITSQSDLTGKRVCVTAPSGSKGSSELLLESLNEKANARIVIVRVPTRPKCLIKLQNGRVDAIVLPSSIVAGLRDQDPTLDAYLTPLNDAQGKPSTNTYGIVTNNDSPDLVLFVNALLEHWRDDGTLQRLIDDNLPEYLSHKIPPLEYRS
jgi:polar amino acid transport system substrate-binding protein